MQRGGCHPEDGCYEPWGEDGYPGADFPWLAANVVDETPAGRSCPAPRSGRSGVKVGYIGMTLEATPTLVAQSGIQGIEFRDEVETANRAAAAASPGRERSSCCCEGASRREPTGLRGISGPIVDIAENLHPEIDLVVTGHTHQCLQHSRPGQEEPAGHLGRIVRPRATETNLVIDKRTGEVGPRPPRPTTW